MAWYAAHIVMMVKFKDSPQQDKYPVWENIVILEGQEPDEVLANAEKIGREDEGDSEGTFFWEDQPAEWIYRGVRKLNIISNGTCSNSDALVHGTEITFSTFEFTTTDSLEKFLDGDETTATLLD